MITTKPKFQIGEQVAVSADLVPDEFTVCVVIGSFAGKTCHWCELAIEDGDLMDDFRDENKDLLIPENFLVRI